MNELFAMPREWLAATGEIGRFTGQIMRDVWSLRVFRFFGEALRQSGILIVGSTTVIWGLVFLIGLGAVRDRGRLLQPVHRHAQLRGRVRGVVQPARGGADRLRLHDGREGGDGDRG